MEFRPRLRRKNFIPSIRLEDCDVQTTFPDDDNEQELSRFEYIPTEISNVYAGLGAGPSEMRDTDTLEDKVRKLQETEKQKKAREKLIKVYQTATMSYVGAVLKRKLAGRVQDRDSIISMDDVSAVWSDLVRKIYNGELKSFGRNGEAVSFRKFFKQVIRNACTAYLSGSWKIARKNVSSLPDNFQPVAEPDDYIDADAEVFERDFRTVILEKSYSRLQQKYPDYYQALTLVNEADDLSAETLADRLSEITGQPVTAASARKKRERAKLYVAEAIIQVVGEIEDNNDLDHIENTLVELKMLYLPCKQVLKEFRKKNTGCMIQGIESHTRSRVRPPHFMSNL